MSRLPDGVADAVGAVGATRVAVVVQPGDDVDLTALDAPGRVVRMHESPRDAARLHEDLAAHGRVDAVVDLVRGRGVAHRLSMLLGHVRPGGVLLVAVPDRTAARASLDDLLDDVRRLSAAGPRPPTNEGRRDPRPHDEQDAHALAVSVAELDAGDHLVRIRSGVETWSVVPEARFDDFLERSPQIGSVVARREAASRASVAPHVSSDPDETWVDHDAPALSLREYDDVVVAPRMVAHTHDLVLPQAFRDTERRRPCTPALASWSRWSARVPAELGLGGPEPERLPGTWFHADNFLRGHFGHAITEQVSQTWAWPEVVARHPDAGALVTTAGRPVAGWELDLLEAAGVPRDRVHAAPAPVRVDRLLAATPGYVIGHHVHPSLRETYAATGDALEARSGLDSVPERVFVGRGGPRRRCHQAVEVEALFERHGFTMLAPEDHPLPDQVVIARHARVVAGYGGSGMFHLLLGGAPRPVIAISHTGYHLWNEKAIAALWDHPITLVRGVPDLTTEHFSAAAMHSDYHLDLDPASATGRVLHAALAQL